MRNSLQCEYGLIILHHEPLITQTNFSNSISWHVLFYDFDSFTGTLILDVTGNTRKCVTLRMGSGSLS